MAWTRESKQAYDKARIRRAVEAGLCVRCLKVPKEEDNSACAKCREYQSARHRRVYKELKTKVLALFGNKCGCCGEAEPLFLTIDHIKGGGNKEKANHYQLKTFRDILAGKRPDLRILCFNCNSGRHINGGVCPHKEVDKQAQSVLYSPL